jgi:Family of unknown function (DUF5681)
LRPAEKEFAMARTPPINSRFKPGASGNPAGRPPGAKNWKTIVNQFLWRLVSVEDGGKLISVPFIYAVLLKVGEQALNGDWPSQRAIMFDMAASLDIGAANNPPAPEDGEQAKKSIYERAMKLLASKAKKPDK